MAACMRCHKEPLSRDEIALHKKLVNRGATEYLCISCLAQYYGCTEEMLREKIEQFRRDGCQLFLQ